MWLRCGGREKQVDLRVTEARRRMLKAAPRLGSECACWEGATLCPGPFFTLLNPLSPGSNVNSSSSSTESP